MLYLHGNAEVFGRGAQLVAYLVERDGGFIGIDERYHYKVFLYDRLGYVFYIDIALGKRRCDRGDYACSVAAYYRYYCFHRLVLSFFGSA